MFNFAIFKFWSKPYLLCIRCYENVMVFAPGGDRGCPHQSVNGNHVYYCLFILTVSIVRPLDHKCLVLV